MTEWTSSIEVDEKNRNLAVLKGGNFRSHGALGALPFLKTRADLEVRDMTIGFRCVYTK